MGKVWVVGLLLLSSALAQSFELRYELEFSSGLTISQAFTTNANWSLAGHLEGRYTLADTALNWVLNPSLRLAHQAQADLGLSELSWSLRQDPWLWSIGLERLALETARLSLPFSLETTTPLGQRIGLWSLRTQWSAESTRWRLGLLFKDDKPLALLSSRQAFSTFELEGHALYRHNQVLLGVGGSGTYFGLVVYGEVWALAYPPEWRYAVGLSGNLEGGLWTLEGGYTSPLPQTPPRRLLAGSVAWSAGQDSAWNLLGGLFWDADALHAQLAASHTLNLSDAELISSVAGQFGSAATLWVVGVKVRVFW